MATSERPSPWASLPAALRTGGILGLSVALVAGSLLYAEGLSSDRPELGVAADAPGNLARPNLGSPIDQAEAEPADAAPSRSRAVLRAPEGRNDLEDVTVPPFPTFGTYVYSVSGSEQAALMGSRGFPSEARLRVHRPPSGSSSLGPLETDEVLFDLNLGPQHSESEVVAYTEDGLLMAAAARSITFGGSGSSMQSSFEPPIPQVPVPLSTGSIDRGTSQSRSPGGGSQGSEEWTVHVRGERDLQIMGETITTWAIAVERTTRGGSESFTRTRTYWFDPGRSIWVQWEEETRIQRGFAIGGFNYQSSYRATLARIEPL